MGYPHLKTTTNSVSINKDCNRKIFTQSVLDWNMLSIYIVLGDSMTIVQLLNFYLNLEFAKVTFTCKQIIVKRGKLDIKVF